MQSRAHFGQTYEAKLKGNTAGISDVYSELFDSLMKKYVDHP